MILSSNAVSRAGQKCTALSQITSSFEQSLYLYFLYFSLLFLVVIVNCLLLGTVVVLLSRDGQLQVQNDRLHIRYRISTRKNKAGIVLVVQVGQI